MSLDEANHRRYTIVVMVADSKHTLFINDRLDKPLEVDGKEQDD